MVKKKTNVLNVIKFLKLYWWVALLIILPAFIITWLTLHYSVHVPFWDQWEFVKILEKNSSHNLGFGAFWEQHNEHRIFFPRLIWFVLAMLTAWDPYYEVVVNLILGGASLFMIGLILKRTFSANKALLITTSILASWLMLSPIQQENWLWGWQIQWFLSVLAVLFTIWCLTSEKLTRKMLILAIIGGTVATYSLANGLTIWGIGLLLLLFTNTSLRQRLYWTIAGIVITGINYYNYVNIDPPGASKTLFLHQPGEFIHYILVYLGRPLSFDFIYAPLTGFVLLGLFTASVGYIFFYQRARIKTFLPWLAIATYALLGAVLTAISRLGLGVEQSYSSRYTTISTLFVLATIILTIGSIKLYATSHKFSNLQRRVATYLVLIPVSILVMINYVAGVYYMKEKHQHLLNARECAQTAQSREDECLLLLYPEKTVVWDRLEYLRSKDLGGF